jgi:hypothetical protein
MMMMMMMFVEGQSTSLVGLHAQQNMHFGSKHVDLTYAK